MRAFIVLLLLDYYGIHQAFAQLRANSGWAMGAYSSAHADLFSATTNFGALAELTTGGIVVGSEKRYGLAEFDMY